jgi:hypothetical protein
MSSEEDQDFEDLKAYHEGTPDERRAAARRLDERALREGQISQEDFDQQWGSDASPG